MIKPDLPTGEFGEEIKRLARAALEIDCIILGTRYPVRAGVWLFENVGGRIETTDDQPDAARCYLRGPQNGPWSMVEVVRYGQPVFRVQVNKTLAEMDARFKDSYPPTFSNVLHDMRDMLNDRYRKSGLIADVERSLLRYALVIRPERHEGVEELFGYRVLAVQIEGFSAWDGSKRFKMDNGGGELFSQWALEVLQTERTMNLIDRAIAAAIEPIRANIRCKDTYIDEVITLSRAEYDELAACKEGKQTELTVDTTPRLLVMVENLRRGSPTTLMCPHMLYVVERIYDLPESKGERMLIAMRKMNRVPDR
jgi:hypothetical protein